VKAGARVGVCGVVEAKVGTVDNKGALSVCDFITEYIAPGDGRGVRGAGTRMMSAVLVALGREGDRWAERALHGHVWRHNAEGRKFWEAMGMRTADTVAQDEGRDDARAYPTGGAEGEWGYMRGGWGGVCDRTAARLALHAEGGDPAMVVATYDTMESLREDEGVHRAVVDAVQRVHGRAG